MTAVILVLAIGTGDAYLDTFTAANQAYESGNYDAAIEQYEQLIGENVTNPAVFYNLGNAYYRRGRIGAAIANYERALALDPRAEHARHNLDKAVAETRQHLARPLPPDWEQSLLFWHYGISRQATFVLAGLSWFGFWLVLALRQWRTFRYSRTAAAVAAVLAVAFALSAWDKTHPTPLAVADAEPTPVRYGTSENETVRFNLYPGDRVTVDARSDGWARVTTADGERGWTQESNLVFVGPPYERPPAQTVGAPKEAPSQ